MMEEVSMNMALDARAMEQMSEEEIFACLEAEQGPKFTVPTKKAKLKESLLQIMEDKEEEEDPVDKYVRENRRLQQVSHRLEQENDNLAHRLISGKVELRRSLDKAEEKVFELSRDLLQSRKQLQATEEEKILNEEETAMLKEVFRRELEKAEQRANRSSGIVEDYKQICSQLTDRLERQQAAHREEVDSLKSTTKSCARCQHVVDPDNDSPEDQEMTGKSEEESSAAPERGDQRRDDREKESLRAQIRELERDLAQTKLLMVEAKCKIQELEHEKGILASDLQEAKNSWISKAFTSLRTSSGGLYSLGVPKDGAPAASWNLHGAAFSKKLSWPHSHRRKASENVDS
ncbi:rab GTPase-activating protein 1-like [Salarias fasciatus]|uniref:Rab GTPase-activating protein 1-like n=1 Tax=Salarias fasciatus TaxID=181472 RepID=A0A672J0C4_SALFA|nr:rab GTPase-activating protein 1-like [Salarias fasciatus]